MNYSVLKNRLNSIRNEIKTLRAAPYADLKEKIEILGEINILLVEQNELLYKRQSLFKQFLESKEVLNPYTASLNKNLNYINNLKVSAKSNRLTSLKFIHKKEIEKRIAK